MKLVIWCVILLALCQSAATEELNLTPAQQPPTQVPFTQPDVRDAKTLSPDSFRHEYVMVGKPILLQDAVSHSPALSLWTEDYLKEKVPKVVLDYISKNDGGHFQFSMPLPTTLQSDVRVPFCLQCPKDHFYKLNIELAWNRQAQDNLAVSGVEGFQVTLLCLLRGSQNQVVFLTDDNVPRSVTEFTLLPGDCVYMPAESKYSLVGENLALLFHWTEPGVVDHNNPSEIKTCSLEFNRGIDVLSWMSRETKFSDKPPTENPAHFKDEEVQKKDNNPVPSETKKEDSINSKPTEDKDAHKNGSSSTDNELPQESLSMAFWKSLRVSGLFEKAPRTTSPPFPYPVTGLLEKWHYYLHLQPRIDGANKKRLEQLFSALVKEYLDKDRNGVISESEYLNAVNEHTPEDSFRQDALVVQLMGALRSLGVDLVQLLQPAPATKQRSSGTGTTKPTPDRPTPLKKGQTVKTPANPTVDQYHRLPLPDNDHHKMKHYCHEFVRAMHRIKVLHEGLFPVDIDEEFPKVWERATMPNPFLRALFHAKPDVGDFLHVKMKKVFQNLLDMDKDTFVSREEFRNALAGEFTDNLDYASILVVLHNFVDKLKHESELDLMRYIQKHKPKRPRHDEL